MIDRLKREKERGKKRSKLRDEIIWREGNWKKILVCVYVSVFFFFHFLNGSCLW